MQLSIRSKLILYTALPVIAVYSVLFGFGVSHVSKHLGRDAQVLLAEHARHQASRLGLLLSQIPVLAESLGDLIVADPAQKQALLYAHLIDGLRRTPAAQTVAVSFGAPNRSAIMERGASAARPLDTGETLDHQPGWHALGDRVGFTRPIYRNGEPFGTTWVIVPVARVYAQLEKQNSTSSTLFVRLDDGTLLPPASGVNPLAQRVSAIPLPPRGGAETSPTSVELGGIDYWLINARVPDAPWWLTAAVPVDTALARAQQEAAVFATALLLSLLLIVAIIGAVARQITRPLQALDADVQRIAAGNFIVAPQVVSDDELGRLAKAIGRMARHIADREHQLRASHQALEFRVAERTAALQEANEQLTTQIRETRRTQAALRQANKQAQQANRAKSEFLSNISHELRTPLHGVLGYAQMLRRNDGDAESRRESLVAIERCGQHLLTLINDILDLTRIEAGQMHVDAQVTELAQLLGDVCTIVQQRAQQKGLSLRSEIAEDLPRTLSTDPVKLRQILLNLLGNAVKFTHSGSVELRVARRGDKVTFVVSDSGEGIPGDKIEAIFDAFHQAREGQATDGTGLGLAISQRLIRLLGGDELRAESQPGEGSRFSFSLPLRLHPATADGDRPADPPPPSAEHPPPSVKLALIDADGAEREAVRDALQASACSVETFASIDLARPRLAQQGFDVVIIGLSADASHWAETAEEIRAISGNGSFELVAAIDDGTDVTPDRVETAGYDGLLRKPLADSALLDLVRSTCPTGTSPTGTPSAAAERRSAWPAKLARATATRIYTATEMGDVARLFQIAEELSDTPGLAAREIEQLAAMARDFDFDGLRRFAARLQSEA